MREQYRMDVKGPMLHLAERNLLLKIFQERARQEGIGAEKPCEVELALTRHSCGQQNARAAFSVVLQRGESTKDLPRVLKCAYQIEVHKGWFVLHLRARCAEELNEAEIASMKLLVADMAETLKLFANGDCYVKLGAEKLIAEIAQETGIEDPTAWTKAYLAPPPYMERPEVRRYYRLYRKLNHAQPQNLLRRTAEELVETPV